MTNPSYCPRWAGRDILPHSTGGETGQEKKHLSRASQKVSEKAGTTL